MDPPTQAEFTPEIYTHLLIVQGSVERQHGRYARALAHYEQAEQAIDDPAVLADLLRDIAIVHDRLGAYEQAANYYERSLALYEAQDNRIGIAESEHGLGWMSYRRNQLDQAIQHHTRSLEVAEAANEAVAAAKAATGLAVCDAQAGRFEAARDRLIACVAVFRQAERWQQAAQSLTSLGLIYGDLGDNDKQLQHLFEAMALYERISDINGLHFAYLNLGFVYLDQGDLAQAETWFQKLADSSQRTHQRQFQCQAHAGLSEAALEQGRTEAAAHHARLTSELAEALEHQELIGIARRIWGDYYLATGEPAEAQTQYEHAIALLKDSPQLDELAKAEVGLEQAQAHLVGQ